MIVDTNAVETTLDYLRFEARATENEIDSHKEELDSYERRAEKAEAAYYEARVKLNQLTAVIEFLEAGLTK